jgi:micrococcal nuclease
MTHPMGHGAAASIPLVAGLLVAAPPRVVEEFSGKVVGITDGDTIEVLVNMKAVTVRLEGIDAPESRQSHSTKAKEALAKLAGGKTVTVRKTGTDRYNRTLGVVMVGDLDVNAKLVEDGWAWHLKKYNDEKRLAQLEEDAQGETRSLGGREASSSMGLSGETEDAGSRSEGRSLPESLVLAQYFVGRSAQRAVRALPEDEERTCLRAE